MTQPQRVSDFVNQNLIEAVGTFRFIRPFCRPVISAIQVDLRLIVALVMIECMSH